MEIRICSHLAASHLLSGERGKWDAIVVLDSNTRANEFINRVARRNVILHFDDIESDDERRRMVTSGQIRSALEFAEPSKRLVVTCRAGQSRSAALAFLIACRAIDTDSAIALLNAQRHLPNRLVIRLGAALLSMPEYEAAFLQWKTAHSETVLADYYEDIEREVDELEKLGARNWIIAQ